jgi:hypothetical protein
MSLDLCGRFEENDGKHVRITGSPDRNLNHDISDTLLCPIILFCSLLPDIQNIYFPSTRDGLLQPCKIRDKKQ